MPIQTITTPKAAKATDGHTNLQQQHSWGNIQVTGNEDALYERHLLFDNVVKPSAAGLRERNEAFARPVRDILSQRWVATEETYSRENPKHIYYLSVESPIGRSLANNVTNLLLASLVQQAAQQKGLDILELFEQEPDAGLGNGGLRRLAACFLDSPAALQLPSDGVCGQYRQAFTGAGVLKAEAPELDDLLGLRRGDQLSLGSEANRYE
jgi:starch phosphorylase